MRDATLHCSLASITCRESFGPNCERHNRLVVIAENNESQAALLFRQNDEVANNVRNPFVGKTLILATQLASAQVLQRVCNSDADLVPQMQH